VSVSTLDAVFPLLLLSGARLRTYNPLAALHLHPPALHPHNAPLRTSALCGPSRCSQLLKGGLCKLPGPSVPTPERRRGLRSSRVNTFLYLVGAPIYSVASFPLSGCENDDDFIFRPELLVAQRASSVAQRTLFGSKRTIQTQHVSAGNHHRE